MRLRFALSLLFCLTGHAKEQAQDSLSAYTDTNSVQALRTLKKNADLDPKKLSEAEGVEWVRARFAWIALLRLEGKEEEASEVFAGCGAYCEKWGPEKEWLPLKAWGCARTKSAAVCKRGK